jgi:hypothetical protein
VFVSGYAEPPLSLVRCVRKDAVEPAQLYCRTKVWKDRVGGGGATLSSSSSSSSSSASSSPPSELESLGGRHRNMTLWGVGNQCHTFLVTEGFTTPSSPAFTGPQGWQLKGSLPGTSLHQAWASEIQAQTQPSMEWALWVLDCFLENCAPWELTAGGILSGQTYEALLKCIVDASH